jgi:WD40 repeat protein
VPSGHTHPGLVQEIPLDAVVMDALGYGASDAGLFTYDFDARISTWSWDRGLLKSRRVRTPDISNIRVLSPDAYVGTASDKGRITALAIGSLSFGRVLQNFDVPSGKWLSGGVGASRNGRYAAGIHVWSAEGQSPAGQEPGERAWLGLVDVAAKKLKWTADAKPPQHDPILYGVAVSDDGRYVAVGPWETGLLLCDTVSGSSREILMPVSGPLSSPLLRDLAFSADGARLYAGDRDSGYVRVFETWTGSVLAEWMAAKTAEAADWSDPRCLALSPDDEWLAVATAAGGVWLFRTRSGDKMLLPYLDVTSVLALSFSPDSKRIALLADRVIEVWDLPPPPPLESTAAHLVSGGSRK